MAMVSPRFELEADQRVALRQLQRALDARDGVRLAGDRLEVLPHDALPDDPAVARLQGHVERLRPHVEITDVLADVDAWTDFSGQLTHAAGATPRVRRLGEHLHAALLAWGMNLGPTRMAESCQLTYRQLAWATEWYLSGVYREFVRKTGITVGCAPAGLISDCV